MLKVDRMYVIVHVVLFFVSICFGSSRGWGIGTAFASAEYHPTSKSIVPVVKMLQPHEREATLCLSLGSQGTKALEFPCPSLVPLTFLCFVWGLRQQAWQTGAVLGLRCESGLGDSLVVCPATWQQVKCFQTVPNLRACGCYSGSFRMNSLKNICCCARDPTRGICRTLRECSRQRKMLLYAFVACRLPVCGLDFCSFSYGKSILFLTLSNVQVSGRSLDALGCDSFFPFCLAKLKRNFAGTIAVSQDLVCQELVPAAFCHYPAIHHHLEFDGLWIWSSRWMVLWPGSVWIFNFFWPSHSFLWVYTDSDLGFWTISMTGRSFWNIARCFRAILISTNLGSHKRVSSHTPSSCGLFQWPLLLTWVWIQKVLLRRVTGYGRMYY